MSNRARRLTAQANHPNTQPVVASRIRASVRRARLTAQADHPNTTPVVAERIRTALHNQAQKRSTGGGHNPK